MIVGLSAAFLIASRTTGAGWLTILIAIGLALLGVGIVAPVLSIRQVAIAASAPQDAVVGRPFDLDISAIGPLQFARIRTTEPTSGWTGLQVPAEGGLQATATRRGIIDAITCEIATASPVGLVWVTRQFSIQLATPIAVAPRVEPTSLSVSTANPADGSQAPGSRSGVGETVRSIRDYRPGDPLRMIHWPATARMDELVVKELESPDAPHLTIRLDLNCPDLEAEQRASLAYGHVQRGLSAGVPVQLLTAERSGPHRGYVGSMLEAGRRLAYASAGRPPQPLPDEHPATLVEVP